MKKSEVSEVLLTLWDNVDQAGFDSQIKKAFTNCPIKLQKEFISEFINDLDDEIMRGYPIDEKILEKARLILGE